MLFFFSQSQMESKVEKRIFLIVHLIPNTHFRPEGTNKANNLPSLITDEIVMYMKVFWKTF